METYLNQGGDLGIDVEEEIEDALRRMVLHFVKKYTTNIIADDYYTDYAKAA